MAPSQSTNAFVAAPLASRIAAPPPAREAPHAPRAAAARVPRRRSPAQGPDDRRARARERGLDAGASDASIAAEAGAMGGGGGGADGSGGAGPASERAFERPRRRQRRVRPQENYALAESGRSSIAAARALLAKGDVGRGRRILESMVRADAGDTRAWLTLGRSYDGMARVRVLREGVRVNGESVYLMHALAVAEERAGRGREAGVLYERCLGVWRGDGRAWVGLAGLKERAGQIAEARGVYREGVEWAPGEVSLWNGWGALEGRAGRNEEACRLFKRAVAVDGRHVRSLQAWAVAEGKCGRFGEAVRLFRQALSVDPRSAPTYQAFGVMEARRGNLEEARELFREGLRVDGKHTAILHAWATMEVGAGEFEEARRIFDMGVEVAPDSAPMLRAWAAMEKRLGHIDDGKAWDVPKHRRSWGGAQSGSLVEKGVSKTGGKAEGGKEAIAGGGKKKSDGRKLLAVGENLQMLKRLVERRSDEDLRVVMAWMAAKAENDEGLKNRVSAAAAEETKKVLDWAEARGESDIAAFKEFVEERYECDRRIGVYVLNLNIPPLAKKSTQTVPVPAVVVVKPLPPEKPEEWFVMDPAAMAAESQAEWENKLYREQPLFEENLKVLQEIEGMDYLGKVSSQLASRSATALALFSLSLALLGMFASLDRNGYSPGGENNNDTGTYAPSPPTGVDAELIKYVQ